jgi:hypothetical protein
MDMATDVATNADRKMFRSVTDSEAPSDLAVLIGSDDAAQGFNARRPAMKTIRPDRGPTRQLF